MKPFNHLALSAVVLAVIGGVAWHQSRTLAGERDRLAALRERVKAAIPPVASARVSNLPLQERTAPSPRKAPAVLLDEERLRLIHDMSARGRGEKEAPDVRSRSEAAVLAIGSLNNADFRRYLKAVKECPDLSDVERDDHCKYAFYALMDRRPADGLAIYTESPDFLRLDIKPFISRALGRWVAEDLPGAVAWVRETIRETPDLLEEGDKTQLIFGAAKNDPALAYSMITEFEITHPSNATQGVIGAADTPEKRLKALHELRAYLPGIEDRGDRYTAGDYAIAVLGRSLAKEGVAEGIRWADSAGLTPSEISSLGSDIGADVRPGDEGAWVEWFGKSIPGKACARPIRHVVRYWAGRDHKAAATWLNTAPDGEAKFAAVAMFAETVSENEPESAAQWAETLPPGDARTKTLRAVYQNWPKKNQASKDAANAFATKHGLNP